MNTMLVHKPVMINEVLEALALRADGIYVDATFGRGGYTRAILNHNPNLNVVAIDRDPEAIQSGQELVKQFGPRLSLLHGPFGAMDILLAGQHMSRVDGIVFDLGVSSPQLEDAARGFSFRHDGPLDMRMSKSGPSAADIVNEADEKELADIIFNYGEERHSRRIAKAIIQRRADQRITRTGELASIVRSVVPASRDGIDPATRTFQALRIHVNDELGELNHGLRAAEILLKPEGRLVAVAFHSLEDRAVKEFIRTRSFSSPRGSRHAPMPDQTPLPPSFRTLTKKPVLPTAEEIALNPRARSARLRTAERTEAAPFMEHAA